MKISNLLVYIISIVLFLSVVFFAADRFITGWSISDLNPFNEKKEAAYTVATEIDDLFLLNTSEYRLKLIFPHDFVSRDVDWRKVFYEHKELVSQNGELTGDPLIYQACLDAGFDPATDVYEFIVLTAIIKAGINVSQTIYKSPSDYFFIEGEPGDRTLTVILPPAEITELYIEDRRPEDDNFPDVAIKPGQWRELVDFLTPLIHDKVIETGILDSASTENSRLITKILKDSGFSDVVITGQSP